MGATAQMNATALFPSLEGAALRGKKALPSAPPPSSEGLTCSLLPVAREGPVAKGP